MGQLRMIDVLLLACFQLDQLIHNSRILVLREEILLARTRASEYYYCWHLCKCGCLQACRVPQTQMPLWD